MVNALLDAPPNGARLIGGVYAITREGVVLTSSSGTWRELRPDSTKSAGAVVYALVLDGRRVRRTRRKLLDEAWPEDSAGRRAELSELRSVAALRMRAARAKQREREAAGEGDEGGDGDDEVEPTSGVAQRWADVAVWAFGEQWTADTLGVDVRVLRGWRRGTAPTAQWLGALERLYVLAQAEKLGLSNAAARLRAGDAGVRRLVVWGPHYAGPVAAGRAAAPAGAGRA